MRKPWPLLIAPECFVPGCHQNGDQGLMIKCRGCGHWFCEEHIEPLGANAPDETAEASASERLASVPTVKTVKLVGPGLDGLTYYLGECQACRVRREQREQTAARRPINSSWLR